MKVKLLMKQRYKIVLFFTLFINLVFIASRLRDQIKRYLSLKSKSNYEKNDTTHRLYYKHKISLFRCLGDQKRSHQKIVFLGNSLIEAGEWSELFPSITVLNRGIGGDTATGLLARLEESVLKIKPVKLFVMIGINDIANGVSIEFIINEYRKLVHIIQERLPATVIYVQSVLPTRNDKKRPNTTIKKLNAQLRGLCQTLQITYIDLYDSFLDNEGRLAKEYSIDCLHLSGEGYLLWQDMLKKYIFTDSVVRY